MIPALLKRRILQAAAAGASAAALAGILIQHHEGRVYVPYRDPVGVLTVCDGHTGSDIVPGRRYTDAECDALLAQDMAEAEAGVDRLVRVPLDRFQRAALIDFTFNLGAGNLAGSTLLRRLNAGDYAAACAEYARWVYAGGRKLPGLVNRREADAWVCSLQ